MKPAWKQGLPERPTFQDFGGNAGKLTRLYRVAELDTYMDALESRLEQMQEAATAAETLGLTLTDEGWTNAPLNEALERVEQMQAQLDAMTADRDLWREDH